MNLDLFSLTAVLVGLVLAITIHEFSHALVAYELGDTTAQRMGRLSLNPLVHLDPLGSLMMVITALTGFGIGWGKPTPVSPWNLRPGRRLGMAMVAAGGPFSNFLLAFILSRVLFLVPGLPGPVQVFLASIMFVNLGLTAFNLLPLPMLDGFHILMGIVSSIRNKWAYALTYQLERLEPHGAQLLLILLLLPAVLHFSPLMWLLRPVYNLLAMIIGVG